MTKTTLTTFRCDLCLHAEGRVGDVPRGWLSAKIIIGVIKATSQDFTPDMLEREFYICTQCSPKQWMGEVEHQQLGLFSRLWNRGKIGKESVRRPRRKISFPETYDGEDDY